MKKFFILLFSVACFFNLVPSAFAATLDIALLDNQSGTAPFDNGTCDATKLATSHVSGVSYKPGEDACAEDRVIRNGDILTYSWDYSIIGTEASNVTITQTLPVDMKWLDLPPQCKAAPLSSISSDQRTLICNVGTIASGTTQRITPRALLRPSAPNGRILETSATISADASASKVSATIKNIASSRPKYDLENLLGTSSSLIVPGSDGVTQGQLITSLVGIFYNGKGSEPVNSSGFRFSQEMKYLTNTSLPNKVTLYTWGKNGALGACGKLYDVLPIVDPNDILIDSKIPMGGFDVFAKRGYDLNNPLGLRIRSVANSGSITCTQAGVGSPVDIAITGTDSGTDHRPTFPAQGATKIPDDKNYVAAMWVKTWVPLSDASAVGGRLKIENKFSSMEPVSISGQSNFGPLIEPVQNNKIEHYVTNINTYNAMKSYGSPRNETLALPGEVRGVSVVTDFQGEGEITGIIYCEKIDNTKHVVNDTGTSRKGAENIYSIDNPTNRNLPNRYEGPYTLEYGVGGKNGTGSTWESPGDQAFFECDDAKGPWYSDLASVPGGASAITKVRLKIPRLNRIHRTQGLRVYLKFLDHPAGTTIANFASVKVNEILGGAWQHETVATPASVATPGVTTGRYADRVTFNLVDVRVRKEPVPYNTSRPALGVLSGTEATFKIMPSVRTSISRPITTSVKLEDVLPPLLTYVPGSASIAPSKVDLQLDGSTKITWNLTGITANSTIVPITYKAFVNEFTPNLTMLDTCVDVSSPDDAAQNNFSLPCGNVNRLKSAKAAVFVTNPSSFTAMKVLKNTKISPLEDLNFEIRYRNTASFNITGTDVIEVLPFNGDGLGLGGDGQANTFDDFRRNPPSRFHGKLLFRSISGNNGERFYCTNAPKDSISIDPNNSSNQSGGETKWCSCTEFTEPGCPRSREEITAFRITGGLLPIGSPPRTIALSLQTTGNNEGDSYTFNFGARAGGLALPVRSNDAAVVVVGGEIRGTVFDDLNGNGYYDSTDGESGIANVGVSAYFDLDESGTYGSGDAFAGSAFTDSSGDYSVKGLNLDNGSGKSPYVMVVTDTKGVLANYRSTLGSTGFDSHAQNPKGYPVVLSPSSIENETADFGFQAFGSFGDFVWHDVNGNGLQDAGEKGVQGVTIELLNEKKEVVATTTSGAQGAYRLSRQLPGKYQLHAIPPSSAYSFAPANSGDASKNSDVKSDGYSSILSLVAGLDDTNVDVGLVTLSGNNCTNVSYKAEQVAIDNTAIQLKQTIVRSLKYRNQAEEAGACKPLKKKIDESLRSSAVDLYNKLWTDTWNIVPSGVESCISEVLPLGCQEVSLKELKSKLVSDSTSFRTLSDQALGKCDFQKRRATMKRAFEKRLSEFESQVGRIPDTVVVCQ